MGDVITVFILDCDGTKGKKTTSIQKSVKNTRAHWVKKENGLRMLLVNMEIKSVS